MIATAVSHYPKLGDEPALQQLRRMIARHDRGQATAEDVRRAADEMTVAALRDQEAAGLDLLTDGQVRWDDPVTYIAGRLHGFEITGLLRWFESNTYYRQPRRTAPVRWREPILGPDLEFARARASRPVKAVLTGPYTIGTLSEAGAAGHRGLVLELAAALNAELRSLSAQQPPPAWIQVDEPAIAENPSVDYPRDFGLFREAMAILVDGVGARLALAVYHGAAAGIPGLLELPFALFSFDLVQGPAGWRLLEEWPAGTGLGLGIVDARNVRMEDAAALEAQLDRARAATAGAELHVSPSCGLEFLPRDVARRKLELVAAVAHAREAA